MAGSFLLWRGLRLKEEGIEPFEQSKCRGSPNPHPIRLNNNNSCSFTIGTVLEFATKNPDGQDGLKPVIMAISCQNFYSPDGIRINNEAYSMFVGECEFLLMEGCLVYVLDICRDYVINNQVSGSNKFNGTKITIIHLFHPSLMIRTN